MTYRSLTALPVFNEKAHVSEVLDSVVRYAGDVLVVDDGSTDGTSELLQTRSDVAVVRHPVNSGYGAGLRTAFQYAIEHEYDCLVTIDCDGQHEPRRIPAFVDSCRLGYDIVSGSRYLKRFNGDSLPPADRRRINMMITDELNQRLGLKLTDAFCGFKAYRVESLKKLNITQLGYAMPLQLWVQAAHENFRIIEIPVPLIYLDEKRSFGGSLDDAFTRLQHYRDVVQQSMREVGMLETSRLSDLASYCGAM